MSHLPLDARAILDYLNELGYRNISAEQLKEFMKGMQSQSESYKIKFKAKVSSSSNNSQQQQIQRRELQRQQPLQSSTSATRTATKSTATAANTEAGTAAAAAVIGSKSSNSLLSTQRRPTVKVIKCKKPLCHFKFYLDICDHQLAKRIEEQIRTLGGALEFFLTANVTHFITDKAILPTIGGSGVNNNNNNNNNSSNNNNNSLSNSWPGTPQTPGTPKTPQTPYDTATTIQDGKCNVLGSVGCNTPTTGTISRKSTTINTRQTRANAILNRVRRASSTTTPNNVNAATAINVNAVNVNLVERAPNSPTTTPISLKEVKSNRGAAAAVTAITPPIIVSTQSPYIVWQTEYALHFFKKVQHELKDYLSGNNNNNNNNTHLRHENAHAHKLLHHVHKGGRSSSSTIDAIDLKGGGFLKIESIKRNYRPYYQLFRKSSGTEWPKIELTREDGAFRLSPKKKQQQQQQKANVEEVITAAAVGVQHKQQQQRAAEEALVVKGNDLNDDDDDDNNADKEVKMTRKSRSRSSQQQRTQPLHAAVKTLKKSAADTAAKVKSSQRNTHAAGVGAGGAGAGAAAAAAACKQVKESSDKQCGVCEICKIEYDTLTIHLKTKDHEYFAKNSQNFIALDSLIHTSADVSKFLSEDKKVTDLEEMEVENIEVMADENEPDPLEGSEPLVGVGGGGAAGRSAGGGGGAGEVVTPLPLLELTDDKRRLAGGAHHTPSPTLREKSKRSTKGKHSSEKFQNIRLSKSPKSTNRAATTSPLKQQLTPATCTTTTTTTTTNTDPAAAPISSSMLELQHIAATSATAAHAVKTVKTAKSAPARRKTISASALSPPIRAMLPPSSLYKVVGTPETSVYGTPTRKMRAGGGDIQAGGGVHEAAVTASPSLIVKFKKVRTTELNRLNGEAESFMFPKQRTSSELPTDVDRQTTSENAHARSSSSSSLDTSTSDGECSMDVEEEEEREGASARVSSSKTSGGSKQQTGKRAIATAKRRKDSKAKDAAATKQRFPSTPIQPDIQLKHTKQEGARKSTNATVLSKTQQTTAAAATATKSPTKPTATKATTKMSKSLSNVSNDNSPAAAAAKRPTAALSAAAAKANAAAAVLAAITLPEATRKSSRTATAIVTAATTSSRLLRAAVEAAKYNCRQMAAGNEQQQPLVGGGNELKMSTTKTTTSANEVAAPAKMTTPKKSQLAAAPKTKSTAVSTIVTKSTHKRVSVVKLEDRMGDLKNEKKKKIVIKKRSRSSDSDEDDDYVDDREKDEDGRAPVSKCIKNEKPNVTIKKEVLKAYSGLRGVINDDDDDDDYDDEEVDNDDDKDEDYIHCIKGRRKSVAYDNLSALWQSGSLNTSSGALSRKQRAAQREEQKYKLAMLAAVADDGVEDATVKNASETVKLVVSKSKNSKETPTKTPIKLNITATATTSSNKNSNKIATNVDCAPEEVPSKRITTTPTPPPIKPKINERIKFDLANSTRLNQMRYSFERLPVTDFWYRVFMRQDTCTERFFEYYGSTNYRKLPYELGPIPYAHTLNNGICCKLCEKQQGNTSSTSEFLLSSRKQAKSRRGFLSKTPAAAAVTACKVKKEPMEELDSSKSRDSSSGKSHDITAANTNNLSTAVKTTETVATTAMLTTATTNTNSASSTTITQYQHKHKKLAFLHRYRQEQQELQKRQAAAAAATEQQLSSAQQQLGDNSNQCDSNASTTTPGQEHTPRDRKRAGSTHSTTSSTSCASSTATTKTSKNRYFNKHLNKAAAAFLNLELPPRKSPREHASTLALVSCIIKQRQDSQSKPNSEIDEPAPSTPTAMSTAEPATAMNAGVPTSTTEPSDSVAKSSNSELQPTVLRSPRHTRSAAATPVEEMRFTTVISENVKRMRRGQNKYDHSPPVAHTQSQASISRKTGRGRPPRTYGGLQKFLQTTGSALTTNRRSQTPSSVLTASTTALADATVTTTGDRRRRTKHGTGWTTTTSGLVTGAGRQHHSHYTGLLAQGSAVPSIRKTGSKKGVLEFEVDATALKALDAATKNTNVRHLEWQIDKFLQLYGREYDVDIDDNVALRIGGNQETAKEAAPSPPPESSNTITNSTTKKGSISAVTSSATASTSKALRRVNAANVDAKCSNASSSTALTETAAAAPFDSATNTPPPTDYFSSDFDLYDLFTNAASNAASEDEQAAYISGKRKSKNFSLYSSLAMQNYFRKRKSLKSNRTGWPKVQKKKTSVRQQHMLAHKIRFLQDIGELPSKNVNGNSFKQQPNGEGSKEDEAVMEDADEDDEAAATSCGGDKQRRRRGNGVITPPASEMEVKQNNNDDCGDEDTELEEDEEDVDDDEEEEIDDDGETMAETIDEEDEDDVEAVTQTARDVDAAAEADEEDLEDAELDMDAAATKHIEGVGDDVDNDEDTLMDDDSRLHVPATRKRNRRHRRHGGSRDESTQEVEKRLSTNSPLTNAAAHTSSNNTNNNNGVTSTPTKQLLRAGSALRRTPQLLNGSLGSCISPSEKAGDNSDIFTVSSDGLDTDLDMSNSQHDHLHHHHHNHSHHHQHPLHQDQCAQHQQTPKRKFDITKYAPNNASSSSCAAEAATAAVKSLAISQFLKKEVRVQCRRLRAPFRRYRYRR